MYRKMVYQSTAKKRKTAKIDIDHFAVYLTNSI